MANSAGQAAGLAIGAAIGSFFGPAGALAGASIGSAGAGYLEETKAGKTQGILDSAALRLNMEQARLKASETSAVHAENFRQALAHQVALASMRGGSGSLVAQFGNQAYKKYVEDKKAIETGLAIQEAQGALSGAELTAKGVSRDINAFSRFSQNTLRGVDLNIFSRGSKA